MKISLKQLSAKTETQNILERMRDINLTLKTLKKEYEELKEIVTLDLEPGSEILDCFGRQIATYTIVKSNSFDSKAFALDFSDIYEAYKKPSETYRFEVK